MRIFRDLVPLIGSALCLLSQHVDARSQARAPINYLSLVENPQINTPSHRVHALSHFDVTFNLHQQQQRVKLSLEPNHDILAEDAQVQYLDKDGKISHTEPIDRQAHRVFKGSAWVQATDGTWEPMGWARVMVHRDGADPLFEGAFVLMHDHHHIKLRSSYMQTRRESDRDLPDGGAEYMVVFRDSDIGLQIQDELKRSVPIEPACKAEQLDYNSDPSRILSSQDLPPAQGNWGSTSLGSLFGLSKRQSDTGDYGGTAGSLDLSATIGSTAGCPSTKKVALIGVATDCSFTGSFDSKELARQNVINVVNTASNVYESTFNITLGLRNLTISESECPGTAAAATPWNFGCSTGNITQRLNLFSKWRADNKDTNAYWTMMSNCPTDAEVGLSWLGTLCVNEIPSGSSQEVVGANVVVRTSTEWQVFAHESGHTFGAVHDCDATACASSQTVSSGGCCPLTSSTCDANGKYIMNPTAGDGITKFSPCTVGNICSAMARNTVSASCLSDNKGVVTITGSQCGNGIVESGEECDCGGTESCGSNTCCDPKTCKFTSGSVCDDSNEECCKGCQFAAANTVCRASSSSCDPQETCTGTSSTCPNDVLAPDGQKCGNSSGLACASGQCTSRDLQCQTVMGDLIHSNDTKACSDQFNQCQFACRSSTMPSNMCDTISQNFVDGTPCSGGGKCQSGSCVGGSFSKEVSEWVNSHKPLVIGLSVGVGCLVLFMILSCIVRRCRRPRNVKVVPGPMPGRRGYPANHGGWVGPMPPPQQMNQNGRRGNPGYWPGQGFGNNDPPPAYSGQAPAYGNTMASQGRMPSVRYA